MKKIIGIFLFILSPGVLALEPKAPLPLALGEAGRAVVQKGAEYHLLNPAGVVFSKNFQGEAFYVFSPEGIKSYWGFSLMENRQLPLAFSYIKERMSEEQYLSLSTSALILPGWGLGLSVSRWQKTEEEAYWNIQTGLLVKPKQSSFSIGATWDHILPLKGPYTGKRRWGLALAYQLYDWLEFRTDGLYHSEKKWLALAGVEALVSGFLILRLGGRWRVKDQKFTFSGGLGLTSKYLAFDYSLSQGEDSQKWFHAIVLRGFF